MSGFLSGYKPIIKKVKSPCGNLKLRKKLPINQCTENPPLRRSSYLTDDESFKEDEKLKRDHSSGDHSTNINKINQLTEEDEDDKENAAAGSSEKKVADTVIDTVCTRISGINLKAKTPVKQTVSESIFGSTQKSLPDTVFDTQSSRILQDIDVPLSSKKQLFREDDSSSSEENEQTMNKRNVSKKIMMDESDEVIEVIDSEDEHEIDVMEPPKLKSSDSFVNCSSSAAGTINEFFNNPPTISSNRAITHSMIQRFKNGEELRVQEEAIAEIDKSISSMELSDKENSVNENEHVEIGPTDESDIHSENDNIVDLTLDDSGPKTNAHNEEECKQESKAKPKKQTANVHTPISVNFSTQTPTENSKNVKKGITNVKIKFDLKISIKDGSASSSFDSERKSLSTSEESESSVKMSHLKALPQSPFFEQNSAISQTEDNSETSKNLTIKDQESDQLEKDSFVTPTKDTDDKPVIDEEIQSFLTEIYGDAWKTPQMLSNFKIKKYREDLRKSIAANNFESFVGSLSHDLESTRISSPKSEIPIKKKTSQNKLLKQSPQINSEKKPLYDRNFLTPGTYNLKKNDDKSIKKKLNSGTKVLPKTPVIKTSSTKDIQRTPLHLLCDPETESSDESESDEDFNPDDTWNASSDEEYKSEKDRIKKRQSVKHGELVFTLDDSLNDVLKKYEFKPQPQIDTANVSDKPMRRKLFTHTHYEDEKNEKVEEKSPLKSVDSPKISDKKLIKTPKDVPKTPTTFKKTPAPTQKTLSVPKKTPSSTCLLDDAISKKDILKRFSKYSFLKSLDAEANKMLCDPEALVYRENYKTKKNELADKLFKLYNEKVFDSQLSEVPVKWNKKLLTTGGRCNNSRRNNVRNSLIELSDKVLTSADRLRCTLIHEMCHAATWILHGENGHGKTWKMYTFKANTVFTELPKITVCHDYVIEYRYTYLCVSCKARSQTHSKTKKVEEIRCSICKGSIQLFENKKNTEGKLELIPVQRKEPTAFAKFVKLKFKEVKKPYMSHKETMQILSSKFSELTVEEKAQL